MSSPLDDEGLPVLIPERVGEGFFRLIRNFKESLWHVKFPVSGELPCDFLPKTKGVFPFNSKNTTFSSYILVGASPNKCRTGEGFGCPYDLDAE